MNVPYNAVSLTLPIKPLLTHSGRLLGLSRLGLSQTPPCPWGGRTLRELQDEIGIMREGVIVATFVLGEPSASTFSGIRRPEDAPRNSRRGRSRKRNGGMMIIVIL